MNATADIDTSPEEKRYRILDAETGETLIVSSWYADDESNGAAFVDATAHEFANGNRTSLKPQRLLVDTRVYQQTSKEIFQVGQG